MQTHHACPSYLIVTSCPNIALLSRTLAFASIHMHSPSATHRTSITILQRRPHTCPGVAPPRQPRLRVITISLVSPLVLGSPLRALTAGDPPSSSGPHRRGVDRSGLASVRRASVRAVRLRSRLGESASAASTRACLRQHLRSAHRASQRSTAGRRRTCRCCYPRQTRRRPPRSARRVSRICSFWNCARSIASVGCTFFSRFSGRSSHAL